MKIRDVVKSGAFAVLLSVVGGCYDYPPPPTATMGETYTQRKQDGADKLLENITDLTLADAQCIAIKNNPTYIAAFHAVNAARMRYLQAWGAYSPTVDASFSLGDKQSWTRKPYHIAGTPSYTEGITSSVGLNVNWLLFDGLSREFSVLIAKHNFNYQKMLEDDEARTMMRAVAYAYNTVLLSIENKRIAEEDRDFQESSLRDTRLKYQAGAVPLSDVLNFEIAVNAAETDLISADYQYETAIYALAVLMGYPEGTFPKTLKFPSDFKTNFTDLPSVDVYLDTALANRPDLKGYREQLEVAKYQMYQTWSAYSPTVSAYFNMAYGTNFSRSKGWEGSSHNGDSSYSESPSIGYGLTADWMIFNGLIRENKIREYKANLAVAEFSSAAKWLEVVAEVRTAYANYVQSVKQTRIFEKTRDLSAQQRDLVDEGYKAGNTELTRLNEAQRDLVEAETNLASSYINIQNAKAQLDAAVAANSASYYRDPENNAPGELKNTPVALGDQSVPASESKETAPAQAPANQSMIPPVTAEDKAKVNSEASAPKAPTPTDPANPANPALTAPAAGAAKSGLEAEAPPVPTQPVAPVIPADPTKAPEKK
ncbi:MAG: TolC family protein [Victivallales bacterium]|jgi:outer membrane protein TolC|nr:TolC family protein [Victivallales bacterium]